jgi:hypothetical protein
MTASTTLDGLQRVSQRQALGRRHDSPLLVVTEHHLVAERVPRHALMLDELGQLHSFGEQRRDDLAEAVVEPHRRRLVQLALVLDVGPRLVNTVPPATSK